jgi:hypothetical protein
MSRARRGQEFNLSNYSSVSTAIERIKGKLETNKFKMIMSKY